MDMSRFKVNQRLRMLRERAKMSRDELALAIGYKHGSSIQRYENEEFKKDWMPLHLVAKLERALVGRGDPKISREELYKTLAGVAPASEDRAAQETSKVVPLTGKASPSHPNRVEKPKIYGRFRAENGKLTDDFVVEVSGENYAQVAVYDTELAAGAGSEGSDEVLTRILFKLDWLRQITNAPIESLGVVQVDGDSMEPTLRPGDQVLVDTTQRRPSRQDGIYALRRDEGLQVKRITVHPQSGRFTISSDNDAYKPWNDIPPSAIDVIGRVIWLGRRT